MCKCLKFNLHVIDLVGVGRLVYGLWCMGNAKKKIQTTRLIRSRPTTRITLVNELQEDREAIKENALQEKEARQNVLVEEQIQNNVQLQDEIWEDATLHQQRHQTKIKVENEAAKGLLSQSKLDLEGVDIFASGICRKVNAIVQSMAIKLDSCTMFYTCQTIFEQVFGHKIIVPSLLKYYLYPHEAKTQWDFIKSFRIKLGKLKSPCSKVKLARNIHYLKLLQVLMALVYGWYHEY